MGKINIILLIGTLFTGIMAGLFFAWSFSVMNGLAKIPDKEFIIAMQSMNRSIQNPIFFLFFFGTAILLPISTYLGYNKSSQGVFWLFFIATLLYWIGVMGVTVLRNIPLNMMLDVFATESKSAKEMGLLRQQFEQRWNNWNLVRVFSNMAAFILLLVGILKK
jgi:uncharacterized membrane protein